MRFSELREKEVINCNDGMRLGFVVDAEIDICNGKIVSLIVPEATKFFGCFGCSKEFVIPFCDVVKIGTDIILVDVKCEKILKSCKD
ncbi:MAG: YlmC/YmxH family sporulation protein [Lachnospiraceae bacterium]|nr:YlmC/YmxH family sporulation protein [Lachnospiraceae bacterium]